MSDKKRAVIDAAMNAAVILFTLISVLSFFISGGDGNMKVRGTAGFVFFTTDSNILAALTCIPGLVCSLRKLRGGDGKMSRVFFILKYTGTVAVTVTLTTMLLFLGPTVGYGKMLEGQNFFLHLVNPVLCILSLTLIEWQEMTVKETLWGLLPTFIYANVYLTMVIFVGKENGGWADFYNFNLGGMWYISYVVMHLGTIALGLLLRIAGKKAAEKRNAA